VDVEPLFLRGKEAADAGNYDYAVEIFIDVLRVAPNHRNSRIALRGCEMERFRENGGGIKAKFLALLKGILPLIMMQFSGKNSPKTVDLCERYLVNDPTHLGVLMRLAQVSRNLGHLDAAADTLEFARQCKPNNIRVIRRLGQVLFEQQEYSRAIRCYQQIQSLKPTDREAHDQIREIQAVSHLKKSHMETADSYRGVLRDSDEAKALEQEGRVTRTADEAQTEIVKLKKAAEAAPENDHAILALGDAYYRFERYVEAEQAFRKAFEVGKKYGAREKLGNARIRRLEAIEAKARKEAEENDHDPTKAAAFRKARQQRLEFCVKEFEFRRKHHPTDMKLAYQLGDHYFQLGGEENVQHAIQHFQSARSSSALKLRSLHMLGRCFAQNPKTLDMAREQYLQAIDMVEDASGRRWKQLTYDLAAIEEQLGNQDEALALYKKIYAIDAAFRDVTKKIQELG